MPRSHQRKKSHHRSVHAERSELHPRKECPPKDREFNNLTVRNLTVKDHLQVDGTSTFVGTVEANIIVPVGGKGPVLGPAIVLEPDNIKIPGFATSFKNYGRAEATITGRIAVIFLDKLSGLFHYIEVSDFLDGNLIPIVDRIIAILPPREDQPLGYTARIFRRQRHLEAAAIALSVRTQAPQIFSGITFSTEVEEFSERLHLRAIPAPFSISSLVSQDNEFELNAKPASHLDLALDERNNHMVTNGRSFALEPIF